MPPLYFATTNQQKVQIAQTLCGQAGVTVKPVSLDVDEIQGEDPEVIVRDKALRAYQQLRRPLVVSDDSWSIPALKGFPGAYMKSINHWFEPQDFIRLMHGIEDRRIILHQYLAYTDGNITEIFSNDLSGQIIDEARGRDDKVPHATVTVLDSDAGKTLAEVFAQGADTLAERYLRQPDAWHKLLEWYALNIAV